MVLGGCLGALFPDKQEKGAKKSTASQAVLQAVPFTGVQVLR